jgi:hypothetical protein
MSLPRRACLLALLAQPAAAQTTSRRLELRLRPNGPYGALLFTATSGADPIIRIRATGQQAPTGEVVLPMRHGGLGATRIVPLAGRDVVVVDMTGLTGTGVSQRLGAVVAADELGRLRVIGLENLEAQESGTCESTARLVGLLEPVAGGTLRLSCTFQRQRGSCGQRWRGTPRREAWVDALSWDARGALTGGALPVGAGPVQRAALEVRQNLERLLSQHVTDLRSIPWQDTGLFELVLNGLE